MVLELNCYYIHEALSLSIPVCEFGGNPYPVDMLDKEEELARLRGRRKQLI